MIVPMQIDSLEELYQLQQLACKVNEPVYVHAADDSIMVDARSFLGLFTLDFSKPVNIVTDSAYLPPKLGARAGARGGAPGQTAEQPPGRHGPAAAFMFRGSRPRPAGGGGAPEAPRRGGGGAAWRRRPSPAGRGSPWRGRG